MPELDSQLACIGVVLLEERVLRRVIKGDRKLRGMGLQVPHEQCYTLARTALAALVEPDEVAIDLVALPERVVVVAGSRDALAAGKPATMSSLWRKIFHGKIHQAFDERLAAGTLTVAAIRERINRIGQTEFDEIRSVLAQEELLLPPIDDTSTYIEFVALYLELERFAPVTIERTFPALFETAKVDATIALDLDATAILAASRPPGAPERPVTVAPHAEPPAPEAPPPILGKSGKKSAHKAALAARAKGNRARAAILHFRAGIDRGGESDIAELVVRLAAALTPRSAASEVDSQTATRWVEALLPVAEFAARGSSVRFGAGARLLHDLQSACVVSERDVKVVDAVTWALSRGKRPIIRSLPATREVRIAKHVRAAVAKLPACGVPSTELADVLHDMAARADANVRKAMQPKLEAALHAVGLLPHSLPERVAEKKLVDELLDRAVAVGQLSLGHLRDAISKNDLKMHDLELAELRSGDQLLRCDAMLAESIDGVYRRGESYMRFLQKLSSLLFGTPVGRFLTLYLLLPLLGSFAIVEGLQHMIGPLWIKLFQLEPQIATTASLLGGAGFLFLLIHLKFFRRGVTWVALQLWRVVRLVLFDVPLALWRHPLVHRVLHSRFARWVVRPAIPAAITWLVVPADLSVWPLGELRWWIAGGVHVVTALVMSSRFGRTAEERLADWAVRSGRHVTSRIVPGLVRYTLQLFVRLLELFERGIYRVDEWLRFRSDQSSVMAVVKGVLGAIWFVVTYFLRLYVNLFVEPTVNPIKHFPVVTVAAKIILPFTPAILTAVAGPSVQLLGSALGNGFAALTVLVLPGLAGFLVWELKENWRLYRATRSKVMHAIAIGHHGESMVGLLKPGFHSGTIPKLYTKLRRAAWKDDERGIARHKEGLHHVEEVIAIFVERQLVSMLGRMPVFRATAIDLHHVEIGSNRVQIHLACPLAGSQPVTIRLEHQSGWIVASIPEPGWIDRLDDQHRAAFEVALTGFYKLAGVDLVREQLEHVLAREAASAPPYDLTDVGLLVWPGNGYETEALYKLRAPKPKLAAVRGAPFDRPLPVFIGQHALFGREPLYASVWAARWQQIAHGETPAPLLPGPSVLPRAAVAETARSSA